MVSPPTVLGFQDYGQSLLAYAALDTQEVYSGRFGCPNLGVLTVTTGAERIASMLAAAKNPISRPAT